MATVFSQKVQPQEGNWIVSVGILSKDLSDASLAQQYGDIKLDIATKYTDPADPTFSFSIQESSATTYSNILLNKLQNVEFTYIFDDASIIAATRYRQAVILSNAIKVQLTDALTKLRAMPVTAPIDTTFTI